MRLSVTLIVPFAVFLLSATPSVPEHISTSTRVTLGVFDGRTPCVALAHQLQEKVSSSCIKIKWRLKLFADSLSRKPDGYELIGFAHTRGDPLKGQWTIVKGIPDDANAVVYQLESANGKPPIHLLKGDDNVLFFLDKEKRLLVGNYDFSYALNRISPRSAH